jgi:hypothetical protein
MRKRLHGQRAETRRRHLDGQRNTVQAATDLGDAARVLDREGERGLGRHSTVHEETHGFGLQETALCSWLSALG